MSLHTAHGVILIFVFLFLTSQRGSSYYFVLESRRNWTEGLDKCKQNGMKYLDPRSPEAAADASRYLGMLRDSRYWSGLQYDHRTQSFRWEGLKGQVDASALQWESGEADRSSSHECATFKFVDNNALFKMANCSQSKFVACEGEEQHAPHGFRSFSKGKRQTEFCEPNHGTPMCTFYRGPDWEVELLKVESAEGEEDCALLCMEADECVHFNYIRRPAMGGTCLIHGKPGKSGNPFELGGKNF